MDNWMPCSTDVVSGGQWEGETPAPENVEIIGYLDTIRLIPSNEQYLPSLDVLGLVQTLLASKDDVVQESAKEVVGMLRSQEVKCNSDHMTAFKKSLEDALGSEQ